MYNQEILDLIESEYGTEKAIIFCEVISTMYDIKYNACKDCDSLAEYDYERDWWHEATIDLIQKQKSCLPKSS
jgi:hypothetical protein